MSEPTPPLSDVEWVAISEVPVYLNKVMGITRTRQTVLNWVTKGVRRGLGAPVKLRSRWRMNHWYTTRVWLRQFIEATERRP